MSSLFKGIVENYSALEYAKRTQFPIYGITSLFIEHRYPIDRVKKLFDVNVHGAYLTAREAAKVMIPNGGGSIILVASMSASVSQTRSSIFGILYSTVN
jgi:NAD(P)-dependent dehydrogenase (short-subunit alcohol dehydrogenase family)